MKPSGTSTRASAEEAPVSEDALREELGAIDTAVLDQLIELRREQQRLDTFAARAEQMKDKVAESVYRRVTDDYSKRRTELDARTTPLKAQVRAEYRKLRSLIDRLTAAHENARLAKEELEFRHAVGEFDDGALEERVRQPEQLLEQYRAQLDLVEEQKARFLEAFPPGEDPGAEPSPAPRVTAPAAKIGPQPGRMRSPTMFTATPAPRRSPDSTVIASVGEDEPRPAGGSSALGVTMLAPPEPPPSDGTILVTPPAPITATVVEASVAHDVSSDATMFVPAEQAKLRSAAPAAKEAPAAEAEPDERTFLLPDGALVVTSGQTPAGEYKLGAINYIGRSESSQIRLAEGGVSRKHAVVTANADGFTIKDLQSQNGTFVNGQRVNEKRLEDGDRVAIGEVQLVFHSPWTKGGGRAAGAR